MLWLYLQNETDFFTAAGTVLHFAPEDWSQRVFSRLPNLTYVSADLFSRTAMVRIDITSIDYPDGAFDTILCSHVLEHVPDDRRAMKELYRVLKPGGVAILQVPLDRNRTVTYEDGSITSDEEREKAFGQFDHVRWYGLDFPARLAAAGFSVRAIPYGRKFDAGQYGLDPGDEIFLCGKVR